MYSITVTRNLPDGEEVCDESSFENLKSMLEAIADDIKLFPTATSYIYTIVPF